MVNKFYFLDINILKLYLSNDFVEDSSSFSLYCFSYPIKILRFSKNGSVYWINGTFAAGEKFIKKMIKSKIIFPLEV